MAEAAPSLLSQHRITLHHLVLFRISFSSFSLLYTHLQLQLTYQAQTPLRHADLCQDVSDRCPFRSSFPIPAPLADHIQSHWKDHHFGSGIIRYDRQCQVQDPRQGGYPS